MLNGTIQIPIRTCYNNVLLSLNQMISFYSFSAILDKDHLFQTLIRSFMPKHAGDFFAFSKVFWLILDMS